MIDSGGSLAASSPRLAQLSLLACLLLPARPLAPATPTGTRQSAARRAATVANGPLLALDQRGSISAQVQIMPRHDEILAVTGGRVTRVLARGLTTYTCCAGLAPSPRGRYVAFSQTDAYLGGGRVVRTGGLWLTTSGGQGSHRLLRPPTASRPDEPFDITAVSWSPDRHTLAYAVNVFTDTPIDPSALAGAGLWLSRVDAHAPQPRQVVSLASLARQAPVLAACGPISAGLSISLDAVSWASDARTVAVSVECFNPRTPSDLPEAILAADTITGRARALIAGGRDAAFSPVAPRLAYVTGRADGRSPTTLWVADAQGQHARKLVTARGYISSPAWSPDSRRLAYLLASRSVGAGVTTIHTADAATGQDRSVLADNQRGQPLPAGGGRFTRLAWMAAPPPAGPSMSSPSLPSTRTQSRRKGCGLWLSADTMRGHAIAAIEKLTAGGRPLTPDVGGVASTASDVPSRRAPALRAPGEQARSAYRGDRRTRGWSRWPIATML